VRIKLLAGIVLFSDSVVAEAIADASLAEPIVNVEFIMLNCLPILMEWLKRGFGMPIQLP
jgi:hypothetical protein